MNQLMNSDLIHFNERRKIYFNRTEQEETKMRLQYKLFRVETVHQCLQQINDLQSVAMKVNSIIIINKLASLKNEHSEEELHDEKMLMKIHIA